METSFVFTCITLVILGVILDLLSAKTPFRIEQIFSPGPNDKSQSREVIALPTRYHVFKILSGFSYALAGSIFISAFVTNRVEETQKERREEELKTLRNAVHVDVFDSLFQRLMPPELFAVVKSQLINQKTVRRNADWVYDFTLTADHRLESRQTVSFELHNVSQDTITEPTKALARQSTGSSVYLESAYCEFEGKPLVRYNHQRPRDSIGLKLVEEGDMTFIDFSVEIPPREHVNFNMVFRNRYDGDVSDMYFTQSALIDARLTANFPAGYNFDVFSSMSSELKPILREETRHVYKLEGAVLPDQGYVYYLTKRQPKS